jgi:tetratricopeptide (TPR) repeat protein
VKVRERALGPEHPDLAADLALLAAILGSRKKYPEAESLYRRAIDIAERAHGRNHLHVASTLNDLAALYHAQGDATKPERLYKRVLAIKEKHLGSSHPDVATTLNNLGVFYKALERFSEARPIYERVLAILENTLGAAHPNVAAALVNYARLLQAEAAAAEKRARLIQADLKATANQAGKRKIDPRVARFRLAVRPSRIHRWGLFAQETIPPGKQVIEYTGERLSRRDARLRAGRKLHYLFHLDNYWAIDGHVGGSGAQYVNHCCDPSVEVRRIDGHILYFSKRRIEAGEELFLDYRFPKFGPKVPCRCGAANCRGTINVK